MRLRDEANKKSGVTIIMDPKDKKQPIDEEWEEEDQEEDWYEDEEDWYEDQEDEY